MSDKLLKELEQYSDQLIRSGISGEDYMIKIPVKIFGLLYKTPEDSFTEKVKTKIKELRELSDFYKNKASKYVMTKEELESEFGGYSLKYIGSFFKSDTINKEIYYNND